MFGRTRILILAVFVPLLGGCATGSSGGLARGPSARAQVAEIGAPPDSVMQRAWESLRSDGVLARSFDRMAGDTLNMARMESDWIHVPTVYPVAPLSGVSEAEQWIKLLFWAEAWRGGTRLYVEALYDPTQLPTEPTQWARLRPLPPAHPSWQYVSEVGRDISRRLDDE